MPKKERVPYISLEKLPHNDDAEKAVLGAMLRSNTILNDALARLDVVDFFEGNANHRAIYKAMLDLFKEGKPVDPQTVINELINNKELEVAGGANYLLELSDSIITFANISTYIQDVRDQAILRRFLLTLNEIQNDYLDNEVDKDFLNIAESKINKVTELRNIGDFRSAASIAEVVQKDLDQLKVSTTDDQVTGVPTGYPRLNQLTHGWQKGNYIVLAARTGVGKTAFSLNLALNAAVRGVPVAYFSLEMSAEDLFKRLVSGDSNVKYNTLLTGYELNRDARLRLQQSCQRLGSLKFYVEDTSGINLIELVSKIRKLKAQEPDLGLVFVDYIGLVTTSGKRKSDSRQLEIQEISTTLKKIALELKISIVAVAQLNRKVEERGGEPMLSDLRESGSLEQDADIVILMAEAKADERKAFGKKDTPDNGAAQINSMVDTVAKQEGGANAKFINIIIAKNRAGQQGRVPLLFRRDYVKFDTPSTEGEEKLAQIENARVEYLKGE